MTVSFVIYAVALGLTKHKMLRPDGTAYGPYDTTEVTGAVAGLFVLAVMAGIALTGWFAAIAMTIGFSIGFTFNSLADPNFDGLFVVGLVLLAGGVGAGTYVIATGTRWLTSLARRRPLTLREAGFGLR